jgi:hypothetical protein
MTARESEQERTGLDKAVGEAPSPVMRELALIAMAARLTLGKLARRLNQRDGTALKHINVTRHFEALQPREATIASYAAILGVPQSYMVFLQGDAVPPRDVDEALRRATGELQSQASQFRNDGALRARDLIVSAQQDDRTEALRLARVFALAQFRQEFGIVDDRAAKHPSTAAIIGQALTALADYLRPRLDLFAELDDDARDTRLAELQGMLARLFVGEARGDIDHVVSFAVRLLRSRGIDTSAMEETLRKMNRLTYRIGDWARYDYEMDSEDSTK